MWMERRHQDIRWLMVGHPSSVRSFDLLLVLPTKMDLRYVLVEGLAHLPLSISVVASILLVYVVHLEILLSVAIPP